MTRLKWGFRGEPGYEQGVDRGVLYPGGGRGVPWNGLTDVKSAPIDAEITENYFEGRKFRQSGRPGSFGATIEAFTYPEEFEVHATEGLIATHQWREPFGLSYRTLVGSKGYKIHLVYNALTSPSAGDNKSFAETVDPSLYSWEITTIPLDIPGARPSAHLVIDSTIAYPEAMAEFEALLYGSDDADAVLPSPQDVLEFFEARTILRITDHGDGTWTADGPDSAITMLSPTIFQIDWPSAVFIDSETYTIHSL